MDYNKINEELEELKKRIVERRAELNNKIGVGDLCCRTTYANFVVEKMLKA